ncbi:response regulator [Patescibacteria group bacterium]|nr:response regulator [Patescibacteria group bacterium]
MKKYTIQVVEDELALSNTIKDELTEEGFNVIQTFNGEEGFKKAKEEKPDVILLDIIMPKIDGITMLKMLKADVKTKYIPVIVLTVHGDLEKIADTITLGAEAYYIKDQQSLSEITKNIKNILRIK